MGELQAGLDCRSLVGQIIGRQDAAFIPAALKPRLKNGSGAGGVLGVVTLIAEEARIIERIRFTLRRTKDPLM